MKSLVDKIVELHVALEDSSIPHAFGGALALAWCTEQARGTIDIDVNLFVEPDQIERVLAALPTDVEVTQAARDQIERDGQSRLWWQKTPLDVFFNTTDFHHDVASRARVETFMDRPIPFLACRDVAVFKAFFNRDKDWVDIAEMAAAGTLDFEAVLGVLTMYLGGSDDRIDRLRSLALRSNPAS